MSYKATLIKLAMEELENMPMGGVGMEGPTQAGLTAAGECGMPYNDDAVYHGAQQAWLYLQQALKEPS